MSISLDGFTKLSEITNDPEDENDFLVFAFMDQEILDYYKYQADKAKMSLSVYLSGLLLVNAENDIILNGHPTAPKPIGILSMRQAVEALESGDTDKQAEANRDLLEAVKNAKIER
jgi:hypothetical protein